MAFDKIPQLEIALFTHLHFMHYLALFLFFFLQSPIAAWAAFWTRLATEFKDNEYVLGYELINEPWAGDVFAHPELLIPG